MWALDGPGPFFRRLRDGEWQEASGKTSDLSVALGSNTGTNKVPYKVPLRVVRGWRRRCRVRHVHYMCV